MQVCRYCWVRDVNLHIIIKLVQNRIRLCIIVAKQNNRPLNFKGRLNLLAMKQIYQRNSNVAEEVFSDCEGELIRVITTILD